jgi:methionyl-tRNA formyltransferase
MRLAFMGTPDFSVPVLAALLDAGHDISCIYSQPPRPAGRGMKEKPSPVQAFGEARGIAVRTPASLRGAAEQAEFAALHNDAAVVVAYGLLLPRAILAAPRFGCFNVHASLLPRWRGAAPIQRAIMAGDDKSGVCIMRMEEGLDTGPVLLRGEVAISEQTTAASLHDALSALGARLMVQALENPADPGVTQPEDGVTYARKIDKAEAKIDFSLPARFVLRHIHGLSPFPGAWLEVNGARLKVLEASVAAGSGPAGRFLDDDLTIACGDGALRLERLQREGKAPMERAAFLRGFAVPAGSEVA